MGLFNIFSKRKEEVHPEKKSYNTQSLMEIISKKNDEIEKPFKSLATERYNVISGMIDGVRSKLEGFDNHKMEAEEIDPQLLQVLLGNKKILSARLHELCDTLKADMGEDTDSIIRYYKNSHSSLEGTISGTVANYKKIEYKFYKMVDPVLKEINRIADILDSFKDEIRNFQTKKQEIASLEDSIKGLEKSISEKDSISQKKTVMEDKLHALEQERGFIEGRLNSIVSSGGYMDFISLVEARDGMKRKLEENEMMLINRLSPLQRPVNKFLKLVKDGEVIFQKHGDLSALMTNYTIGEGSMSLIREAFAKMGSVMDRLEPKGDGMEKLKKRMDEILESDMLNEIYQSRLKILHGLESMENQISVNKPIEKLELDGKLNKADSDMQSMNNALQEINRDLENASNSIDRSKQSIMAGFKGMFNEDFSLS